MRFDLGQLASGPKPGQRERRLGAARDDELDGTGKVIEEEGEPDVDLRVRDHVVVVQHEHDLVRQRRELVAERGEDLGDDAEPRRPQHGERRVARGRVEPAERMDRIGPEPDRIVVAAVERDPGEGPFSVSSACQSARRVDFPQPAGARMSVSLRCRAAQRSRSSRRETR